MPIDSEQVDDTAISTSIGRKSNSLPVKFGNMPDAEHFEIEDHEKPLPMNIRLSTSAVSIS